MKALEGYRKLGIAGGTIWLAAEGKQWWLVALAFVGYTLANVFQHREDTEG